MNGLSSIGGLLTSTHQSLAASAGKLVPSAAAAPAVLRRESGVSGRGDSLYAVVDERRPTKRAAKRIDVANVELSA